MELFRRSLGASLVGLSGGTASSAAATSPNNGRVGAHQTVLARRSPQAAAAPAAVRPSPEVGRRQNAPLRRASPAQRSYMMALRKRSRQDRLTTSSPGSAIAAGTASSAAVAAALCRTSSSPLGPSVVKASQALAAARRPPAFAPEWTAASARGSPAGSNQMLGDAQQLHPTAPSPSELQGLDRTASAPELQTTPPGAAKRKRPSCPGSSSPSSRPRLSTGDSVAVVGSSGHVEVWDGEDWDHKERAAALSEQLEAERAARSEAERKVRELEQKLQVATEEASRHAAATITRLTKENQRLVMKLAAAVSASPSN
jgi:hypothetical protein